ncbi:unnamed protein product [Bursaphelenchus okinawaensis]|uniref:Uncharacterized protein n=1 Tax=Bursaphelenchus okinawaensis TaxID=465554 RepID=A0A811LR42_9BILA|nr:unnamed protein product [Bursaphelenchus okinawaensis]CAG9127063.1 unnamed protein product [Bursaphelenchus okinawaensis]
MPSGRLCHQIIWLLVLLVPVHAQFGEIASIVTGLLGSGAGPLAGLAGAGASAGTAGAAGAAGALGSVGQLYQLAQAALQLTGTGVGIVNQASESAWFPAAVENAAKMNRELQDRLLLQQKNGVGAGGLPDLLGVMPKSSGVGTAKEIDELGGEFGKEFGSHETTDETENKLTKEGSKAGGGQVPLPGLVSLLPGESTGSTHEEITDENGPDGVKIGTDLEKSGTEGGNGGTDGSHGGIDGEKAVTDEERGATEITEAPAHLEPSEVEMKLVGAPRITVELPEDHDEFGEVKKMEKPSVEFSIDSSEDNFPLIPPKAASPNQAEVDHLPVGSKNSQSMVPELKMLIHALRNSNLTQSELRELTKQLEGNKEIGTPRENTTPQPTNLKTPLDRQPENELEQQEQDAKKKAVARNLAALRRALDSRPELRSRLSELMGDSPVILKLQRPMVNGEVEEKKLQDDSSKAFASPQVSMLPRRFITTTVANQPINRKNLAKAALNRNNVSPYPFPTTTSPVMTTPVPTTLSYAQYQQAYQQYYQQYYGLQQPQQQHNSLLQQQQAPQLTQQQPQQQLPQQNLLQPQQPHYFSHLHTPQFMQPQATNLFAQQPYYSHYFQHQQQLQPQQYQQYNTQQTYQPQQPAYSQVAQQQAQLNNQRPFPARTVASPVVTPAPLLLQHPWSQGSLLTVPQPHDNGK